ncbi:LipA and NB-ARC domain protein [Aspergillus mulundensis]|uniref:LipA and NB-ARC protein n=1 Tax=Aspergillus mulundensis TaxID=1810919 RepID=A0A3D8SLD9_9EURO|nr:hypothetical protein DSM5745_03779 [Aspergillus mulundensis]RDW87137.1 hypothetical protein DSM5745_03779 [Aspergillus mulundensis]
MEIKRKPVPAPAPSIEYGAQRPLTPNPPPPYSRYVAYSPYSPASPHSPHFPPPPPRFAPSPSPSPNPSLQPPHSLPRYRSQPNLRAPPPLSPQNPNPPPLPRAETTVPADSEKSSFYADARHFLGGLISRPSESTKHYSILRHSHGIVFYRGPTTSVTVSIFADTPLPADRSLWLQCKGWSGKTGMRAKALFRMHDDWVNATPTVAVRADQVEPNKERAWQRDIAKFYKKATKRVQTHRLRETVVARIPPDAEDGYFQLILCHGEKKVLCRSPVFRILSTSIDPSSLRGASLSTMPLEIGALVAGTYAQVAASRVVAPVTAVANTVTSRYRPGWLGETAVQTAYEALKPEGGNGPDTTVPPSVESGPQSPYPLDFTARPSQSHDLSRMPVKIPSDIQDKLRGYFFGWARAGTDYWQMIILSVLPWDGSQHTGPVSLSQTTRKVSVVRFIHDSISNCPLTITVRILGFLHADMPLPSPRTENDLVSARQAAAEASLLAEQYDAEYVQALLDHPLWGPETADRRGWFDRTKDSAGNVLTRGQKIVERVGVRSGVEQEGRGGYYIVRG